MKYSYHLLIIILTLSSCIGKSNNIAITEKGTKDSVEHPKVDSSNNSASTKTTDIDLFIDSMRSENFFIDTSRLKEVWAWKNAAKCPKEIIDGHIIVRMPFPVEEEEKYFSDPMTYFFAEYDPIDSSYRKGTDYLLMTWKIDSVAIPREIEIYQKLTRLMGNFPCFCFRNEQRVYAMANRFSSGANRTIQLTKNLRGYINRECRIYGYYEISEIK